MAHSRKYLLNGISHVVSQFIVSDLEEFAISLGRERVKQMYSYECLSYVKSVFYHYQLNLFFGETDESLEHLFASCHYTREFWAEVIKWFSDDNININQLSDINIMLGILDCGDYLFVNHILLIAKRHIYNCKIVETRPSLRVFIARVKVVYQLETKIA